jgi:hypothetical protein
MDKLFFFFFARVVQEGLEILYVHWVIKIVSTIIRTGMSARQSENNILAFPIEISTTVFDLPLAQQIG